MSSRAGKQTLRTVHAKVGKHGRFSARLKPKGNGKFAIRITLQATATTGKSTTTISIR